MVGTEKLEFVHGLSVKQLTVETTSYNVNTVFKSGKRKFWVYLTKP